MGTAVVEAPAAARLDGGGPRATVRQLYLRGFEGRQAAKDARRSEAHRGRRGPYRTFKRPRVLADVIENPGTTAREGSARLGVDRRTFDRNLSRMLSEGLVSRADGGRWTATPEGVAAAFAAAAQLRFHGWGAPPDQGQIVHEGLQGIPVYHHVQFAPLSMALEAADRANRTMRAWGVWSRTIRNAWRYLGLRRVLSSVRETSRRALSIRNLGAYLHRVLWAKPEEERVGAAVWALRNIVSLGREASLQLVTMASESCHTVAQVWRLAHSVKRAQRTAARAGRGFDAGDVYAIASYLASRARPEPA